jgi:hypothetical protein
MSVILIGNGVFPNLRTTFCVYLVAGVGGLKNGTQWNVKPDQSKLSSDTNLRNGTKTS